MPYYLRITRFPRENNRVTCTRPTLCPTDTEPYYKRTPGRVEALRVFATRAEAESAFSAEEVAATFSTYDQETLNRLFRRSVDRVANFGWTITELCRYARMNRAIVASYACGLRNPSARTVARVYCIADALESVANFAAQVLPPIGKRERNPGKPQLPGEDD